MAAHQLLVDTIWLASTIILFIVALHNFNEPPTNRASTTFFLFIFGVTVYYASLLVIWIILTGSLKSTGFAVRGIKLSGSSADAGDMVDVIAPLAATLLILAGGYNSRLKQIDKRARAYCLKLASIPGEVNGLTHELAERTDFNRNEHVASLLLPELMRRENVDAYSARDQMTPRSRAQQNASSMRYTSTPPSV
jgi:hypothetical protein